MKNTTTYQGFTMTRKLWLSALQLLHKVEFVRGVSLSKLLLSFPFSILVCAVLMLARAVYLLSTRGDNLRFIEVFVGWHLWALVLAPLALVPAALINLERKRLRKLGYYELMRQGLKIPSGSHQQYMIGDQPVMVRKTKLPPVNGNQAREYVFDSVEVGRLQDNIVFLSSVEDTDLFQIGGFTKTENGLIHTTDPKKLIKYNLGLRAARW